MTEEQRPDQEPAAEEPPTEGGATEGSAAEGNAAANDRPTIPGSGPDGPPDPQPPPDRARSGADAGSYIGRLPERSQSTIPRAPDRRDRR